MPDLPLTPAPEPTTHTHTLRHDLACFWADAVATGLVHRLIELARDEDLGPQRTDRTASLLRTPDTPASMRTTTLIFREPGVVSGLAAVPAVLDVFDAHKVTCTLLAHDGDHVARGACVAALRGPVDQITTIERTMLNIVGRLSGIATRTAQYVAMARAASATVQVLDTRKTTPGLRLLEKYAVRCGGGSSHRLGLHDAVLFKDNHLAAATGTDPAAMALWLTKAARRARDGSQSPLSFVQVEVDTLAQFDAVLTVPAGLLDHVLLDNFSLTDLRTAVARRNASGAAICLEASGGVSLETIGAIAATGVERISVGSLTHGARSLDVGLDDGGLLDNGLVDRGSDGAPDAPPP